MSKKEKTKRMNNILAEDIVLDIPDDEVYSYQIEGLSAPHINKPYKHYGLKKAIFIIVIVVAVSLSMLFSLMILSNETFTFKENESGVTLSKFSNPGYIEELTINWELDITYPDKDPVIPDYITVTDAPETEPAKPLMSEESLMDYLKYTLKKEQEAQQKSARKYAYFEITEDKTKPVTEIAPYAFNGDGNIKTIYIGENVLKIDGKSFYSCWALQRIIVDENNPNYCDIDGVLYNKDKTEIICYPCDRDQYLREKYNYTKELWKWKDVPKENDEPIVNEAVYKEVYAEYEKLIMTYVIPSTVKTVGELCFNYSNLAVVYLPENLEHIESLAFFEMPNMRDFYTYQTEAAVENTDYEAVKDLSFYISLPDGLLTIGNDAFSFNKEMNYVFIPESVVSIGHHAFWDSAYKSDDGIGGIATIYVERSKEDFNKGVETGDDWVPVYNYNILKKIPVEYGAERITAE